METISIAGGGIAGLALAACLDQDRFEVSVTEQRPELPAVGTVLAMWPNAQRALGKVGVLAEARAVSPVIGSGSIRNAAGEPWITVNGGQMFGISRVDLLRLLDAAVPDSVRRTTGRVHAVPSGASLVVGADGVHSAVRRGTWGERTAARPTPYLAVRGTLPVPVRPEHVGEYWGAGIFLASPPQPPAPTGTRAIAPTKGRMESMSPQPLSRHGSATPVTRTPSARCLPRPLRSVRLSRGSGPRRGCGPSSAERLY